MAGPDSGVRGHGAPVAKEPHDCILTLECGAFRIDFHYIEHLVDSRVRSIAHPREDNGVTGRPALLIVVLDLDGTALSLGAAFVTTCIFIFRVQLLR